MPLDIPLLSPDYATDPRPFWAQLRREAPVLKSQQFGFWVVSRYEDVRSVLTRPEDFSSQIGPAGGMTPASDDAARSGMDFLPMIQHDAPDHTRLRSILSRAFSPRRIAGMETRIREIGASLVEEIRRKAASGEALDFYDDYASPLPVIVVAEILGIPASARESLGFWADATGVGSGERYSTDLRTRAFEQIDDCLRQIVAQREREPQDDLISALVASAREGEQLRPEELIGFCKLLWIAGNETTTNLISNGAVLLQERPELLARLRDAPDKIPDFVEELLRFESPVNGLFRRATRSVELHGEKIGAGDAVWMLFASGNRDAGHFPQPDEFVLERDPNDHLALGFGPHFCLGASLARLEARVGFEVLTELLPKFRLEPERGKRLPTPILRGWLSLPMRSV